MKRVVQGHEEGRRYNDRGEEYRYEKQMDELAILAVEKMEQYGALNA